VSSRLAAAAIALAALAAAPPAPAQPRPANLEALPPVPTSYTPDKTPWGDYDFSHTYSTDDVAEAHILFQRPKDYGRRVWVNDAEFARRLAAAEKSDAGFGVRGASVTGTKGLAAWMRSSAFARRTSLLVDPADGRLPPLTPEAQRLYETGRSSWVPGQAFDWVSDFDTWDRCITRGFPASMFPNRYNNGIRIFQSPGWIVIQMEMLATRIIPIGEGPRDPPPWPKALESWMGQSRAHWEGKTLVIETTNIKSGDSVSTDPLKRSASPVIVTMIGGAPLDTTPMSPEARTVERLTMTGPNTLVHELTYSDPRTYTASWTARTEWVRDDGYKFYEYACHEGDVQIRNFISSSRAQRAALARGEKPEKPDVDPRARFAQDFDRDPGVAAPAPAAPAPPPARSGKEGGG
jgi:hypothetical protein